MDTKDMWEKTGNWLFGHCLEASSELRLANDMGPDKEAQVLIHEVMHAICENNGVKMSEKDTRIVSNVLFCVIRDNPDFTHYLMKAGMNE
jgi:hypothetical protein